MNTTPDSDKAVAPKVLGPELKVIEIPNFWGKKPQDARVGFMPTAFTMMIFLFI